ncbi:Asp-tRNA(Asn)/Glu-tRNA(Gln) amidotransferase subunit GatC [Candidatus Woesearchaeota archaeon]|nr:Asp-tRNA(Asn)/Glu-tRNA(Gln) amidotransferase subunit GatC [Candidatus Woesearchaeota archaeon]
MEINKELIRKVAENARLELSEQEIKLFLPQFKEIIDAFAKLDEVDVSKLKPSFQPVELKNVLREDSVEESLTQEKALSNTEHKKDNYFKGPRAI